MTSAHDFGDHQATQAAARAKMSPEAFDYCAGGACSEVTLRRNLDDFGRWALIPRAFAAERGVDTSVVLLGRQLAVPLGVSAVSMQQMSDDDGENGLAVGAQKVGGLFMLSSFSSKAPEAVAVAAPNLFKLQQIYLFREMEITNSLASRAAAAGFCGFAVTVDTPSQGIRYRDQAHSLVRFERFRPALCDDPIFKRAARRAGLDDAAMIGHLFPNSSTTWADFERFCRDARLPVFAKGIQHPEDAEAAIEAGAAGIIVSNHGGRQLDNALSAISWLPAIVSRVRHRVPVLFDSGVRYGTDAFIALALGASAALMGRAAVWGLAVGGAAGVTAVLSRVGAELQSAMLMTGAATIVDISGSMILETRERL